MEEKTKEKKKSRPSWADVRALEAVINKQRTEIDGLMERYHALRDDYDKLHKDYAQMAVELSDIIDAQMNDKKKGLAYYVKRLFGRRKHG